MRCRKASELMMDQLDGHLDDAARETLEQHLVSCTACRAQWRRMRALDHLFSSTPMVSAPDYLHLRVMDRIGRGQRTGQKVVGGLILALATVTVMLLTLVPMSLWFVESLGIVPTLLTGGQRTLVQLLILLEAQSRLIVVLLDQLALPLILVGLGCLLLAVALNALWLLTVRRLHLTS